MSINLNASELQSGYNRVSWAEDLIIQLPIEHEGRNSWLLNYGRRAEAVAIRTAWEEENNKKLLFDGFTTSFNTK